MCGIVGICGSEDMGSKVTHMARAIQHRGPDGEGFWQSGDGRVAFGHRRLAVIDLSENGAQPMVHAEDRLGMVYNGELYNFIDIRSQLQREGCVFLGKSDSEVLLRGYAKWGDGIFDRITGMYAVAILDEARQELVLARDPCGQKPLYYAQVDGQFAFASEVKALHAWRSGLTDIDETALADFLAYGYTLGPATLTGRVKKVLPGQILRLNLTTFALESDTLTIPARDDHSMCTNLDDTERELERLLQDSVDRHLVSDVPVGLLLSGGIDSSLLTALAARNNRGLRTFSISFPNQPHRDEAEFAKVVADYFGTDHMELSIDDVNLDTLTALAAQYDDPIADHAIVPTYLLSKKIREHVTVALSGDGGDELFGGYPHYGLIEKQAQLRQIVPSPLRSLASNMALWAPLGMRGRNHMIGMRGDLPNAVAHVNMLFDARQRSQLTGLPFDTGAEQRKAALLMGQARTPLEMAMYSDFRTTLTEGYMVKTDRAAMLASLEIRAPFLDKSLVAFAQNQVPPEMKYSRKSDKILPRRLAARLLPTAISKNKKRGLTMPLDDWLTTGRAPFFRDVLFDSSQTLFNKKVVKNLFDGQNRGYKNGNRIFALTMATLWARHYGMSRG